MPSLKPALPSGPDVLPDDSPSINYAETSSIGKANRTFGDSSAGSLSEDRAAIEPPGWRLLMEHIQESVKDNNGSKITQACETASMLVAALPAAAGKRQKEAFRNSRDLQFRVLEPLVCLLGFGKEYSDGVSSGFVNIGSSSSIISISNYCSGSKKNQTGCSVSTEDKVDGLMRQQLRKPSIQARRASLDALMGYLEQFGPSIIHGWSIIFSIIDHCLIETAEAEDCTTIICNQNIILINWDKQASAIHIKNKIIAESYKKWFSIAWKSIV
jgi:hypothetical protein